MKRIFKISLVAIFLLLAAFAIHFGGKKTFASDKASGIEIKVAKLNTGKNFDIRAGFADIIEPLMPAVVNIYTVKYRKQKRYSGRRRNILEDDLFKNFKDLFEHFDFPFDMEDVYSNPKATSLGSGFIIDPSGLIVTNHHVISTNGDVADEIYIKLTNNKEYKAKIVGSDERTDLALLKIDVDEKLSFVEFGDSEKARTGDWVIAIGNPFGLGGTVTTGIISSTGRDIDTQSSKMIVDNYIQTDAAINSGNSGGPMFDINGRVIGINRVIISPSGANAGIGFAIPSSAASPIIERLRTHGEIKRGKIGVAVQAISEEMADALGLKNNEGVLVVGEIQKGGPADKAGIKAGDVITEFDGHKIKNIRTLHIAVAEASLNKKIEAVILRDGKRKKLYLTITEKSAKPQDSSETAKKTGDDFVVGGVIFSNITPELRKIYRIDDEANGIIVTGFERGVSPRSVTLRKGDLIVAVNNLEVKNIDEVEKIYKSAKDSGRKYIMVLAKSFDRKRGTMSSLYVTLPIN